ncbi:MAG: HD domain-containing protein, partial [Deltaproteobacteria bacterium]|nr:HD domain-containing protein [Deltaproteobacteria bacterium]
MDDTVLKIAIAAFMHDIGKLVHREVLSITDEYINNHADLYQPFYEGRHTHLHAVFTAAFIEKLQDRLPKELNQAHWGEGDAFINLAAGHHRPETPMQWVVTIADWISSGWDREPYNQETQASWRDYQRVRLIPILEQLQPEPNAAQDECSYGYPLRETSPTNIFPRLKRKVEPVDTVVANQEYKFHFEKFIDALGNLKHREENLELWFEHFDSLVMIYTSAIPSDRSGKVVPDVSLYDHARTTAALAVTIYLYHQQTNSLTIEAIKNYADRKFLLINGDFYGIQ